MLRSGIAGWMQAWAPCVVDVAAPSKERLDAEAGFPIEMHQEVTMILAAMVLNGYQEAIA